MDITSDHWLNRSANIWHRIMDQLNELKEWQRTQEEIIKRCQTKQIHSLSEQNVKLNALTNTLITSDGCVGSDGVSGVGVDPSQPKSRTTQTLDDSLEEFRAAEEECRETSGLDMNCGNKSFAEDSVVSPGIDGRVVKTFDDLLDRRLSDHKVDQMVTTYDTKPKKPFLRKGEGIKRFGPKTSQPKDSSIDVNKKLLKTNETKSFVNKTKPKGLPKLTLKRKEPKNEDKFVNTKSFNRKVIPLTTKIDKNAYKSAVISRDTPTVIRDLNDSETDLIDYFQQICENISVDDNSIESQLGDKGINELQELLKKIELKKSGIESNLKGNDRQLDERHSRRRHEKVTTNTGNREMKKRVHWSPQHTSSGESGDESESCDFSEPKSGAYSSALKSQINELEERLSRLKTVKNDNVVNDNKYEDTIPAPLLNPLSDQLLKLTEQIERLNKRIVNIESKSYDLIKPQMKEISNNKQKVNIFSQNTKTLPKTRTMSPPSNGLNISVTESPNDTTINFPNGDKMNVSKDNTIFYTFANGSTQTTYADGLKITNFPNGQIEKVHKNGVKHIIYGNGLQRTINPDGSEEVFMTDGTVWRIHSDGSEVLEFANGDREIRTDNYKRREYSDGNIKTLYSDGTEETRYICGRLRIKDRFGNLMVDSMIRHLDQHF